MDALRYYAETEEAEKVGIKRAFGVGVANAMLFSSFMIMYTTITFFGGWMLTKQVRVDGCDPSGALDPRNKCDLFGLPNETNGASVLVGMIALAIGGQALGQIATGIQCTTRKCLTY